MAFSLGQVARYVRILEIARKRYEEIAQISQTRFLEKMNWAKQPGTRKLTSDEIRDLDNDWKRELLLHREIETYFMFSNILLGKIAYCIEDFFGLVEPTGLHSHNQLCKNIKKYSQSLSLVLPEGFWERAVNLKDIVTDFRNNQVTHFLDPRAIYGTMYHPKDRVQMSVSRLNPKSGETQVDSPNIKETNRTVGDYIDLFIEFIQINRDKSRYNAPTG